MIPSIGKKLKDMHISQMKQGIWCNIVLLLIQAKLALIFFLIEIIRICQDEIAICHDEIVNRQVSSMQLIVIIGLW